MLVLQIVKVLPSGARIVITDEYKTEIEMMKANSDGSLIFNRVQDSEKYYNIYSTFKCAKLEAYTFEDTDQVKYFIEVRG